MSIRTLQPLRVSFTSILRGGTFRDLRIKFEDVHACAERKLRGEPLVDRFTYVYGIAYQSAKINNDLNDDQLKGLLRTLQKYWQEYTEFFV